MALPLALSLDCHGSALGPSRVLLMGQRSTCAVRVETLQNTSHVFLLLTEISPSQTQLPPGPSWRGAGDLGVAECAGGQKQERLVGL